MLLHHKSQTKGDDAAKGKGVLQHLESKNFVKFMYFWINLIKVLSNLTNSFQRDQFCITNLCVYLEAGISQLDVLRLQGDPGYQGGVLKCGAKKNPKLKLTKQAPAVCDPRKMNQD